jgi:hypothetical protein
MSNIPGFTAEASLSKASAHYRTASYEPPSGYLQLIAPQSFRGTVGDVLKDIGELLWDGIVCSAATLKIGAACAEALETGDVAACTDAISEWPESCIKD